MLGVIFRHVFRKGTEHTQVSQRGEAYHRHENCIDSILTNTHPSQNEGNKEEGDGEHKYILKRREKGITNNFGAYGFVFRRKDSGEKSQGYLSRKNLLSA